MRIILFSKFNAILRGALQKASHRVANRRRGSEKIRKMQRKISKIRKKREPLDEALIKKRNIFLPNVSTGFALCRDFFPTVCAALRSCASAAGVFAHGGLRRFAVLRFGCRGIRPRRFAPLCGLAIRLPGHSPAPVCAALRSCDSAAGAFASRRSHGDLTPLCAFRFTVSG